MTVSGILYHALQQSEKKSSNDKSEVRTGFLCVGVCACVYTHLHLIVLKVLVLKVESKNKHFQNDDVIDDAG